jgi:hypothetical protein
MYLFGSVWGVLAFLNLITFKFDSLLTCGVCVVLIWSNVYGYWQCSKDARTRLEQGVQAALAQGTIAALSGRWGNIMGGSGATQGTATGAKAAGLV